MSPRIRRLRAELWGWGELDGEGMTGEQCVGWAGTVERGVAGVSRSARVRVERTGDELIPSKEGSFLNKEVE